MTWAARERVVAPTSGSPLSLSGLRILLVDRSSAPAGVAPALRHHGAALQLIDAPEAALRALDGWRPDLLVVDLGSIGGEAYELIRRVRELPGAAAALPAIAIASPEERVRAIKAGFSALVAPGAARDDLATLAAALARSGEDALPSETRLDHLPAPESDPPRRIRTLDVVVPLYNEELGAAAFHRELAESLDRLDARATIYYVDDGSIDGTGRALAAIAASDERVVVVELSRNFGHQAALSAGLDLAQGDAVITMDGDGQHPADAIPAMLEKLESGWDVVIGQRTDSRQPSAAKRWSSSAFYWLLGRLSATHIRPGCADFRAMARPVVQAMRQMPERHRFVRGMVAWLGFRTAVAPYAERPRRTGVSKFSLGKMLRLASDAVSSFSLVPLYVGLGLGALFLLLALLEVGYVLSFWARGEQHRLVPGWSSLMFAILIVGGFAMVAIGIIGSYVGYVFQEVKRRPVYVVRGVHRGSDRSTP